MCPFNVTRVIFSICLLLSFTSSAPLDEMDIILSSEKCIANVAQSCKRMNRETGEFVEIPAEQVWWTFRPAKKEGKGMCILMCCMIDEEISACSQDSSNFFNTQKECISRNCFSK